MKTESENFKQKDFKLEMFLSENSMNLLMSLEMSYTQNNLQNTILNTAGI